MRARAAGDLLALDPSINSSGLALFRRGELLATARVKRTRDGVTLGERAVRMSEEICAWVSHVRASPTCFVYEWPQIYPDETEKNPNDLIGLSAVGNGVALALRTAAAARNECLEIVAPLPREWTGGLPKTKSGDPWESPRGGRIKTRLRPEEIVRVKAQHDVLDGVGLGLWALGRFERVRVFSYGDDEPTS